MSRHFLKLLFAHATQASTSPVRRKLVPIGVLASLLACPGMPALALSRIIVPPDPPKPVRPVVPISPVPDSPQFRELLARGKALFDEVPFDAAHGYSAGHSFEAAQAYAAAQKLRPGDGETAMDLGYCAQILVRAYTPALAQPENKTTKALQEQVSIVEQQAYDALYDAQALDPDSTMIQSEIESLDGIAYLLRQTQRNLARTGKQSPRDSPSQHLKPEEVSVQAELNLARQLISNQQPEQALPHLLKATNLQGNNYLAWGELGSVQFQLGRYADAEASLRRGVELERDWPAIVAGMESQLGAALLRQGKLEDARKMLVQSLLHAPHYSDAWRYIDELANAEHKPLSEFVLLQRVRYNPRINGYVHSETVDGHPLDPADGPPSAYGVWLAYATAYRDIEARTSEIYPQHDAVVFNAWRTTFDAIDKSTLAAPGDLGTSDASLNTLYRLYSEGWLYVAVLLFCSDVSTADDLAAGKIHMEPQRIIDFIEQTRLRGYYYQHR